MCQAIPRRVLRIDGTRVQVDYDDCPTWVDARTLAELKVGEYVVVYAGQAIERMATDEAEEVLAWYADLDRLMEEAVG